MHTSISKGWLKLLTSYLCVWQWWQGEVDRLYAIHRARCLWHDYSTHRSFSTTAPLEVYHVRERVVSGGAPPRVKSVSIPSMAGHRRSRSRGKKPVKGRKSRKEERSAMIDFVVRDLPPELYAELVAGLSLC